MLSMHVEGVFTHCLLPEEGAWPLLPPEPPHSGSFVTISAGLSLSVRILETPGLHSSDEEVLRAEGLVVEGVAVARAAPVQVPVDVECLAATSTCRRLSQWLPLCLARPPRRFPPALSTSTIPAPALPEASLKPQR